MNTKLVVGAAISLVAAAAHAQTIGAFNFIRGGDFSFSAGSQVGGPRGDLNNAFPGVSYQDFTTLSSSSLGGVDVLILCSPTSSTAAINPLDPSEQSALLNFVLSGRGFIGFVDNDTFAGPTTDISNQSLLDVFFVNSLGTDPSTLRLTNIVFPGVTPVATGPYGSVTDYVCSTPGWFQAPAFAITAARLSANFEPALLVIPENVLGPGAGRVVLFSDTSILTPDFYSDAIRRLLLNAVDYVRPIPPCNPDLNQDGNVDQSDVEYLVNVIAGGADPIGIDPDFTRDGNSDQSDIAALINVVAGGNCP